MKALFCFFALISIGIFKAQAGIIFTSGGDDFCEGCTTSQGTASTYITTAGNELDGASWIQSLDAWYQANSGYSILEIDLSNISADMIITSLFVSYDDNLVITNDGSVLFDSANYNFTQPWTKIIDVVSLVGAISISADSSELKFSVDNAGGGATGVVWKGAAVEVSSSGIVSIFSLALFVTALTVRRKNFRRS